MVPTGESQTPRHVQDRTEEVGLAEGKAPSTLGTKDTAKTLAEAEDSVSDLEELPEVRQDAQKQLG